MKLQDPWEIIGDDLLPDTELGIEVKQLTQRMKTPDGWRVLVTRMWKEGGRLKMHDVNFRVTKGYGEWNPHHIEEKPKAQEAE